MTIHAGDYSQLADDYAAHRAGYAPELPTLLLGWSAALRRCAIAELDGVDLGAGTGIWTRQLSSLGLRIAAVEPNDAMRRLGAAKTDVSLVRWVAGRAEATGLADRCCDVVTMASALHWTDLDSAMAELRRILRPGGLFAALWNTREFASNPLLLEIEHELERRFPGLDRGSSGRSSFCESLSQRLGAQRDVRGVTYIEGHHVEQQSKARYLGLWRSANNLRAQLSDDDFGSFLRWIESRLGGVDSVDAAYRTRVWVARIGDAPRDRPAGVRA